jgi:type II secretory pathway pseudopilin PulG
MRACLLSVLVAALIPSWASAQSSAKPSKEQLRQNAIEHREKQADFKQKVAAWRADNRSRHEAEYDAWASRSSNWRRSL